MENYTNKNELTIASKTSRLLAFLIDTILIQTLYLSYIYYAQNIKFWDYLEKDFDLFETLIGTLIALFYGCLIYPLFSGNLGHRIMGLKVVTLEDQSNFKEFYEGGFREFLKSICVVLILPVFWIFFDKKNQNTYDKLFKTIVVKR
jgi:uncharacterized RDD family membrane protein YckC